MRICMVFDSSFVFVLAFEHLKLTLGVLYYIIIYYYYYTILFLLFYLLPNTLLFPSQSSLVLLSSPLSLPSQLLLFLSQPFLSSFPSIFLLSHPLPLPSSSHSKYTCRYLDMLTYIPDSSQSYLPLISSSSSVLFLLIPILPQSIIPSIFLLFYSLLFFSSLSFHLSPFPSQSFSNKASISNSKESIYLIQSIRVGIWIHLFIFQTHARII